MFYRAQLEKAGAFSEQYQNRATQEALLLLSKGGHRSFAGGCQRDFISQTDDLHKQISKLYGNNQVCHQTLAAAHLLLMKLISYTSFLH